MTAFHYATPFFDLQVTFAETVAALSSRPLAEVVLDYTNFYARFGLGRGFDPAHPVWQEYVRGLRVPGDAREWTYRFYLTRADAPGPPSVLATFGCFGYARSGDDRLRLHFANTDGDGRAPLGPDRRGRRLSELRALFDHVKRTEREPRHVRGASWLYNLEAYRCLFPEAYLATAAVMPGRFRHMPLWGQFLDRNGTTRAAAVREFLTRLARQSTTEKLDACFPLPVLAVEAPVSDFYRCYGV